MRGMNQKLEQKLFDTYPALFGQKDFPLTQTAMCWGVECGDGWFKLVDKVCSSLMRLAKITGNRPVSFSQVKEKYGTLRIYYDGAPDDLVDIILEWAEQCSRSICENCGECGKLYDNGWVAVRCPVHAPK